MNAHGLRNGCLLALLMVLPMPRGWSDEPAAGAVGKSSTVKIDLQSKPKAPRPKQHYDRLTQTIAIENLTKEADRQAVRRFAIRKKPNQHLSVDYSYQALFPRLMVKELVSYCPDPPTTPGQQMLRSRFWPQAQAVAELSPLVQPVYLLHQSTRPKLEQNFKCSLNLETILFERRLVQTYDKPAKDEQLTLSDKELARWTRKDALFDFDKPAFVEWCDRLYLTPDSNEAPLDFVYRVYQTVRYRLGVKHRDVTAGSASQIVSDMRGRNDSFGLSVVLASIFRMNKLPARVLVGRWAQNVGSDNKVSLGIGQPLHAVMEVFIDQVGWLPIDITSSIHRDPSPNGLLHFGYDPGAMLTLHYDGGLLLDTKTHGHKRS